MIVLNALLLTFWDKQPLIDGALIAIEGKTIIDFGKMGKLVDQYEDTEILIEGHTDSTGPRDYNMSLSLRRAQTAANFMSQIGVRGDRFHLMGYGPDQPVAENTTQVGRQSNRRVEIAIYANDKLKSAAKKQVAG